MKVVGTLNGTGATVYVSCGFIPESVKVWALDDSDLARVKWNSAMRALEVIEGYSYVGSSGAVQEAALGYGAGIAPYYGGDVVASTAAYAEGAYVGVDHTDYRLDLTNGGASIIDAWTLGSAANRTGKFNADTTSTTRIGEGSVIHIMPSTGGVVQRATVLAVTAGAGGAANEVTLSQPIPSGKILYIGGMYSFAPLAAGTITAAGFKINATTLINVNDELQSFEASQSASI